MPVFKRKLSRHLLAKSHRYRWAFLASLERYNSLHFVHADEVRTANYHTYKEYFNRPPLWKRSTCLVQSCPYCSIAPSKLPVTVVRQTMTGFNGFISEEITGEGYDVRTKSIHMNLPRACMCEFSYQQNNIVAANVKYCSNQFTGESSAYPAQFLFKAETFRFQD